MGFDEKAEAKGTEIGGAAKQKFGELTDNESIENEGRAEKAEGKAKGFFEDVKDKAKDAGATIKEAFDRDEK